MTGEYTRVNRVGQLTMHCDDSPRPKSWASQRTENLCSCFSSMIFLILNRYHVKQVGPLCPTAPKKERAFYPLRSCKGFHGADVIRVILSSYYLCPIGAPS